MEKKSITAQRRDVATRKARHWLYYLTKFHVVGTTSFRTKQ